jgi:hypothetical protein
VDSGATAELLVEGEDVWLGSGRCLVATGPSFSVVTGVEPDSSDSDKMSLDIELDAVSIDWREVVNDSI